MTTAYSCRRPMQGRGNSGRGANTASEKGTGTPCRGSADCENEPVPGGIVPTLFVSGVENRTRLLRSIAAACELSVSYICRSGGGDPMLTWHRAYNLHDRTPRLPSRPTFHCVDHGRRTPRLSAICRSGRLAVQPAGCGDGNSRAHRPAEGRSGGAQNVLASRSGTGRKDSAGGQQFDVRPQPRRERFESGAGVVGNKVGATFGAWLFAARRTVQRPGRRNAAPLLASHGAQGHGGAGD